MSANRPAIKSTTRCKVLFFNKLIKISDCAATAFLVIKNGFCAISQPSIGLFWTIVDYYPVLVMKKWLMGLSRIIFA